MDDWDNKLRHEKDIRMTKEKKWVYEKKKESFKEIKYSNDLQEIRLILERCYLPVVSFSDCILDG